MTPRSLSLVWCGSGGAPFLLRRHQESWCSLACLNLHWHLHVSWAAWCRYAASRLWLSPPHSRQRPSLPIAPVRGERKGVNWLPLHLSPLSSPTAGRPSAKNHTQEVGLQGNEEVEAPGLCSVIAVHRIPRANSQAPLVRIPRIREYKSPHLPLGSLVY